MPFSNLALSPLHPSLPPQSNSSLLLNVALYSNNLILFYNTSDVTRIVYVEGFENEGEWYSLEFTFHLPNITVSISSGAYSWSFDVDSGIPQSTFHPDLILCSLSLFGLAIPQTTGLPVNDGFDGCIRYARLDGQSVSLDQNSSVYYLTVEPRPLTPGCPREEVCVGQTACLNGGMCLTGWDGYSCDCPVDYEGVNCSEGTSHSFFIQFSFLSPFSPAFPLLPLSLPLSLSPSSLSPSFLSSLY